MGPPAPGGGERRTGHGAARLPGAPPHPGTGRRTRHHPLGLRPEFAHQSGLFNGRAGTLAALTHLDDGSRETARAIRAHLAGFGWHAIPYQGHLTFLGDQTLRLSADLGTGASGVLLTVNAALTGRPCLPFFSAPRPASLGPEPEPVRILAGTAS
ncbi:hypothetical protein [Streptomyces flavidovirens]|uniref:hypothetical protein n=1 Tax=Streptomyces flavidovirens TaxID=67298 RepID=UPI00041E7849|nr:hypothetical protein [Streptomyces flavidovirens]